MDRGFYFEEIKGLLSKMTVERVWPDLDRRSRDERLGRIGLIPLAGIGPRLRAAINDDEEAHWRSSEKGYEPSFGKGEDREVAREMGNASRGSETAAKARW